MNLWVLWLGKENTCKAFPLIFSVANIYTNRILPWNGPLGVLGLKAAPALAAGNVIIIKPSEKTPFAAAELGKLALDAGFPPGVFQVLAGDGSTGSLLASHMEIAKVSFTGSVPTGKTVQTLAAKSNLKRCTLELGGKSPAVVFDDADLENAVNWWVVGCPFGAIMSDC